MAKIIGVCKNIDDCTKAQNREVQEIEKTMPFVCEECEKPLLKSDGKPGTAFSGDSKKTIIAIVAAVVVIGSGIGAYFGISNKSSEELTTAVAEDTSPGMDEPTEIKIESVSLNKAEVDMFVNDIDTLKAILVPANAPNENMEWTSQDAKVATIENGIVKAVGQGQTTITLKDTKGDVMASSIVKVKEKESTKPISEPAAPRTAIGQISYGKWTGGTKNGKPHGTQVTFTFTYSHEIDTRDPKKRIAQAGDYIIGEYDNGQLVQGRWYKNSGGFEAVVIGK